MVVSADGVPTVVTYVPNSKVTEVMTKGGEIVNDKGLIILANRRGAGEVEVHDKTNHIFIIVEGEADVRHRRHARRCARTPRPVRFGQRVSTAARRTN
jgi:hypothetical protein